MRAPRLHRPTRVAGMERAYRKVKNVDVERSIGKRKMLAPVYHYFNKEN